MKRRKLFSILLLSVPLVLAGYWLVSTSRAATETPRYTLIRRDGAIEIRDYPALTLATTAMDADGADGSFGRLFRFITGANETSEKISMTTPVLIDTANDRRSMSFIMPDATVAKGVPKPAGENVSLGKVEAARFAVLRFAGGRAPENETKAIAQLTAWLTAQEIAAIGKPVVAYYDPPWTPSFLRRNEVKIRISKNAANP